MSDISTQVVGAPQIIQLKPQEITDVKTSSEYFPVNDDIPIKTINPSNTVANVNAIFKAQVIDKAIVTASPEPVAKSKSKLPLIAGLAAIYFALKGW